LTLCSMAPHPLKPQTPPSFFEFGIAGFQG
jgi:hypothetical protein